MYSNLKLDPKMHILDTIPEVEKDLSMQKLVDMRRNIPEERMK
jgi:hypothetical protein